MLELMVKVSLSNGTDIQFPFTTEKNISLPEDFRKMQNTILSTSNGDWFQFDNNSGTGFFKKKEVISLQFIRHR